MSITVAIVLGALATVAVTVLLYWKVLPKKLDGTFDKPILQFLHDFFHFKKIYLEEVLKAIYTVATVFCVCFGFFLLFSGYTSFSYYSNYSHFESYFGYGLLMIIAGPISLRLVYEGIMLLILLVKNVIEINNKLPGKQAEPKASEEEQTPAE